MTYEVSVLSKDNPSSRAVYAEAQPGCRPYIAKISGRHEIYKWAREFVGHPSLASGSRKIVIIVPFTDLGSLPCLLEIRWGRFVTGKPENRAFWIASNDEPYLWRVDELAAAKFIDEKIIIMPRHRRDGRAPIQWDQEV